MELSRNGVDKCSRWINNMSLELMVMGSISLLELLLMYQ